MIFWLLLIAIAFVILIVIFVSVPWAEKKALFLPSKNWIWTPSCPYKNIYLNAENGKVHTSKPMSSCKDEYINGWHFDNFPRNKTVMYCHGNSLNISNRSYIIDICHKFKLNLFIFDYRGFGKSSGKPTKRNLRKDGETAYKYLTKECGIKSKKIIIWGESLGGITAIWTASKYSCQSLILLCTFSGLDDAITYYFEPGVKQSLAYTYANMVSMRYDIMPNRKYIRRVKCPVAILHSKKDDIIPYECAKILYKNINHDAKVLITIKGGHSSPIIRKEQLKELFNFCDIPYEEHDDIDKMLKDLETVAERHHKFIDK